MAKISSEEMIKKWWQETPSMAVQHGIVSSEDVVSKFGGGKLQVWRLIYHRFVRGGGRWQTMGEHFNVTYGCSNHG